MISVLIADDHAVVRHGLREILSEQPDMVVVGEAPDVDEVLRLAREHTRGVLILDISLGGRNGLELLEALRARQPELQILILSMHSEEQFAVQALKAGAAGYLTKECAPQELVAAIRKVDGGGKYISSSLAERLARALGEDAGTLPHERLTEREYQVMCRIASGKTVTEIADDLCLSVKTISTYRTRLLEKMGMKSNTELTHYAARHGLLP